MINIYLVGLVVTTYIGISITHLMVFREVRDGHQDDILKGKEDSVGYLWRSTLITTLLLPFILVGSIWWPITVPIIIGIEKYK